MNNVTEQQVFQDVVDVLNASSSMLGASDGQITKDTYLAEDLGVDSLRLVSIMSELEDHYDIEFDVEDTDPRNFHQVPDLVNVTLRTIGAAEA